MKLVKGTSFMFCLLVLGSCQNPEALKKRVSKILISNPEIITEIIRENPVLFVESLNKTSVLYRDELTQERQAQEFKRIQNKIKHPLFAAIDDSMVQTGPHTAPITIVEYIDFQSPYCEKSVDIVKAINDRYSGKVRIVYKHLPLALHEMAYASAQYFEAIKFQNTDKAIKFHELVIKAQTKLKDGTIFLDSAARKVGANMKKLKKDLNSNLIKERIEADILEAHRFGIKGVPGFIVNGVPIRGAYPPEHFFTLINELQRQGKLTL